MKANEVPEKLYVDTEDRLSYSILYGFTLKRKDDDIEYVHTDAFIEKACEWLKNSTYGYLTEKWGETDIDRETLVSDFKNYMKGE